MLDNICKRKKKNGKQLNKFNKSKKMNKRNNLNKKRIIIQKLGSKDLNNIKNISKKESWKNSIKLFQQSFSKFHRYYSIIISKQR